MRQCRTETDALRLTTDIGDTVRTAATIVIGLALWGPPVAAIVANRSNPDIGTALGVPYAFIAGIVAGVIMTIVIALAARRWPGLRPYYVAVGAMMAAALLLFPLANQGMLSTVG